MGKQIVRLGDPSDHGGIMVTASGKFNADGKQVCVDGDLHTCGISEHGTTAVTATAVVTKTNGKYILRVGDVAGCGAVIIKGSGSTGSN